MNQEQMPIVDALRKHKNKQPISFHVPGHKNGEVIGRAGQAFFSKEMLQMDQTELTGLDDLHDAEGIIAEAQQLAADLYGAESTLFLVGGSTAGNHAMILASFQREDTVFVQRDVHKSIINGLRLAGVRPVFLFPEYDQKTYLSKGLSVESVNLAFAKYPHAKGIILTSPSYYGWVPPLAPIIQKAHEKKMVVLVDEAHGAHFQSNDAFPASALEQGADVVVQSAHKTLPALTMGAYLHIGKESYISSQAVKEAAAVVQTSSPSYLVLSSLDMARYYVHTLRECEPNQLTRSYESFQADLEKNTGLSLVKATEKIEQDPLKCIVKAPEGYSGWTLQHYLEQEYIYSELADQDHVLLVLPLRLEGNYLTVFPKFQQAVSTMMAQVPPENRTRVSHLPTFSVQETEREWLEMFHVKQKNIEVERASGKIAGVDIIPYPPGIPLFFKGEKITGERFSYLLEWVQQGGRIQGGTVDRKGQWYVSIMDEDE